MKVVSRSFSKLFTHSSHASFKLRFQYFVQVVFLFLAALCATGCDLMLEGAQKTGAFQAEAIRQSEGMTFKFRLHKVKYEDQQRLYVWCVSEKTKEMSLATNRTHYVDSKHPAQFAKKAG
jgi:hypothetical protein